MEEDFNSEDFDLDAYLEAQRERRRRDVPPEDVEKVLSEMRVTLDGSEFGQSGHC